MSSGKDEAFKLYKKESKVFSKSFDITKILNPAAPIPFFIIPH